MKLDTKALRKIMIDKDIESKADLARRLGKTRQAINLFFRSDYDPLKSEFRHLCRSLDIDPKDIMK